MKRLQRDQEKELADQGRLLRAEIDDPLPGQPDNVFRRIKHRLFAAPPGANPGSDQTKMGNDE